MPAKLRPLRFLLNGPRAKPRLALGVAFAVLAATAAWSFTRPKIYEATAQVLIPYRSKNPRDWDTIPGEGRDVTRLLVPFIRHPTFTKLVADKLTAQDLHILEIPTQRHADTDAIGRVLNEHLILTPCAESNPRRLDITFRHQDASAAVHYANLFATCLVDYPNRHQPPITPPYFHFSPANQPAADAYVSPNHPLNLSLGLLAGLALGTLVSALATRRAARAPRQSASEI